MAAKSLASPSKTLRPLDPERTLPADPRDPRMDRAQWPCLGVHTPGKSKSNKWAAWTQCEKCGLRLEYVPKQGSPATNVETCNPFMVRKALQDLREMLPSDMVPNETLVKACYDKVAAEERLKTLMLDYKEQLAKLQKKVEKVKPGMTSAKSGAAPSVMAGYQVAVPQTPRSATTSWAQVTPPHSPELNETFDLMTEDEKQELTNRLRQRRESIPVSDTEINPPCQQ